MNAPPTLLRHQTEAIDQLVQAGGSGGLFFEMGMGKSRAALEICQRLECVRVLCVVPTSVASVWPREAGIAWPTLAVFRYVSGGVKTRTAHFKRDMADHAGPTMAIVNYEAYWREPLRSAIRAWDPEAVIYDESHRLKGRGTRQARFAHLLAPAIPVRLALTGTPMPNGPEDLYSIYKAILPKTFDKRWVDFETRYIKRGGFQGYQIVGYKNLDEIERILQETAFRVTKAEALDLPEQTDSLITVPLSDRRVYDRMRRRAIAEVEGLSQSGQVTSGTAVANVVLTNILRLQQITSGFVKADSGEVITISREKERTLQELLSDMLTQTERVVVFCRFRYDVEHALAAAAHIGMTWRLDGTVPADAREAVLDEFRAKKGTLVVQIQVGSLGIDLSCASVAVFYSFDYSLANYLQARDRLHRIGQRNPVTYYHLLAENTVDEKIYGVLKAKEDLAKSLLDLPRLRSFFDD